MKDWEIRALKTFVQAFGGILIPELCVILSGNLPESVSMWQATLTPILCSALAGGISAAWNIVLERLKEDRHD